MSEDQLPRDWYNINPDKPASPGPVLQPQKFEPEPQELLSAPSRCDSFKKR